MKSYLYFLLLIVCVPFLCGCGCAVRVWGACIIPCLTWSSCCFKIPDPICLLYNFGCAIWRGIVEIAIAVVEVALLIAEGVLYAVEGVIYGLTVIVDKARVVLDIVIGILEAIRLTVVVGLKALEAITKFLLTGIIDIREMDLAYTFLCSLTAASQLMSMLVSSA